MHTEDDEEKNGISSYDLIICNMWIDLCVCVPFHSWPENLFSLQHLQDEFTPILLQVIGMKALRKLNATKLYPHLE